MARKLNEQELERFRELLVHLRGKLSGDIDELEVDAFATDGERGSVDNPADSGSDSFAQEFSLELLRRDEAALEQVDEAMERLTKGSFGICESCEGPIPRARLNAIPYARCCVGCQRRMEAAG